MRLRDCTDEKLIMKDESKKMLAQPELDSAEKFILSAKKNLGINEWEVAEMLAYMGCFHAARALLYSRGYNEKTHACLFAAVMEFFQFEEEISRYAKIGNQLRVKRHGIAYAGATTTKDEAEYFVSKAREFLEIAGKALEK
ncbi:MAG: HEPN domain-containing protein [Candidatus Micrarchaeia archaeon]